MHFILDLNLIVNMTAAVFIAKAISVVIRFLVNLKK